MESVRRFLGRYGFACLGVFLFSVCALVVFWQALPKFAALVSPDAGPFFGYAHRTSLVERLITGGAFTPHALYWMIFPPLYAHDLTYILDSLILCLAGVFYLKGRRVHAVSAWFGGLALGFSGYTFTLFSAGHRGYFHMFACAVWAFGLLLRCFETRKLFYFAVLGLVLAWGATYQPDVLVLVVAVAAAYALWLTGRSSRVHYCDRALFEDGGRRPEDGRRSAVGGFWRTVIAVWPRFGISVLVLVLAGFGSLRSAVTTTMSSRDAQIARVTGSKTPVTEASGKRTKEERHERWLFATGWSLPPEDVLEFVAPGVFGDESMQMPYPYWGRLGRPADEVFQKGRMTPNYRQHTVYLGVISFVFALFGAVVWLAQRKGQNVSLQQAPSGSSDVPFWCGVWVVCLVLALGRYTPVYRLFYALPYMDYIRAPVKFIHLVEVASAFLAGFGMDAFLRGPAAFRRKLVWLAGGLAAVLTVGAALMLANKATLVNHIASLGLGQVSVALGGYAVQNLMRSVVLAGLVAGVAVMALKVSDGARVRVAGVLLCLLALDQALVARRYARVINVTPFYHANTVVTAIKRGAAGRFVNVVNYVTPNTWPQDWFSTSLLMNGIHNLAPGPGAEERETPRGKLFTALQGDPVKLWRLCGVEYVIVPRKGVESLVRAEVLSPVLDFELGQGVVRQVPPGENTFLLARVRNAEGAPRWVSSWKGDVPADRQAGVVAQDRLDVSDAPPPASSVTGSVTHAVQVLSSRGQPGVFATRIHVALQAPGLFIFDEQFVEGMEVLVDGKRDQLYRADSCLPAVLVPEGEHEISLRLARRFTWPLCGVLTTLAVLLWGAAGLLWRVRRRDVGR